MRTNRIQPTRRSILAAGVAGAATAVLAASGCAAGGTGTRRDGPKLDAGASATAVKGHLTVWSWDVAATALKRLAPEFERRHPGVTVDIVDIGYDNAYDKITVGLKSGKGLPDITTVEGPRVQSFIGNFPSGFYDLTALAGPYKDRFDQAAWRTASDEKGRVLALPWDTGPCALYYRRDHFQEAGVDPNALRTWDDYVRAGEQIKAKTGKKLLALDNAEDNTFLLLLQQQGQGYFKDGKVAVGTPQALRAMTLLKTLRDKDLIAFERGWDGYVTATKEGKIATAPYAAWWAGTLTGEMKELKGKFGVVPLPAFDAGGVRTSNNGGSLLAVTAQTGNARTAWAFTQFILADSANQVSMLQHEGLFPAFLPALQDPYLAKPSDYFGGQPVNKTFADLVRSIPRSTTPRTTRRRPSSSGRPTAACCCAARTRRRRSARRPSRSRPPPAARSPPRAMAVQTRTRAVLPHDDAPPQRRRLRLTHWVFAGPAAVLFVAFFAYPWAPACGRASRPNGTAPRCGSGSPSTGGCSTTPCCSSRSSTPACCC
ncbi:ABC transporter substrate-binding protein [Actinomadura sp. J1-007]|uniref:ABC transporter substrate-binding protein n=1 Tax=Actinomadura sp. J1-007 TaxID=2661913 RepID=UPI0019D65A44|nr:sugar ABC transporter substrate-binding protein [Actinomadura sp. J1-007]